MSKSEETKSVNACDFSVKKYSLSPIIEPKNANDKSPQVNAFPRYSYTKDAKEPGKVVFVTKSIKITRGGIPPIDENYRPSENDCMYFWLPLDDDDEGGSELRKMVMDPLDEYHAEKHDGKKIAYENEAKPPIGPLAFGKCVQEYTPENGGPMTRRIKVRLMTEYNDKGKGKGKSLDAEQKIITRVFINDENGDVKEDPENIKSMADLRKVFTWNCTAQFALIINKFWVMKSKDNKTKTHACGLSVKCVQMHISHIPESGKAKLTMSVGVFGLTPKKIAPKPKDDSENEGSDKPKSKAKAKPVESEDEDSDKPAPPKGKTKAKAKEESDEDSDKPAPPKAKGKGKAKQESEDEDSDKPPPPKAKGKAKAKEESDEDSDKPAPPKGKAKAKAKEESDDESDSDKPAPKKSKK